MIIIPVKEGESDLEIQLKIKLALEDYGNEMNFKKGHKSKITIKNFKHHVRIYIK